MNFETLTINDVKNLYEENSINFIELVKLQIDFIKKNENKK